MHACIYVCMNECDTFAIRLVAALDESDAVLGELSEGIDDWVYGVHFSEKKTLDLKMKTEALREGEILKEKTSWDTFSIWADLYWSKMEGTLLTRMPFKNWFLDNHVPFIQNDKKLCGDVSLRKLCTIPMLSFIIFDPILLIILLLI